MKKLFESTKNTIELVKAIAEICVIAGAIWWAWERKIFIPRINLGMEAEYVPIESDSRYFRTYITIKNIGEVPVGISGIRVRIFQIKPLVPGYVPDFSIKNNQGQFNWPQVDEMDMHQEIAIKPNEEHIQSFEFILSARIQSVRVLFEANDIGGDSLVWRLDKIVNFKKEAE